MEKNSQNLGMKQNHKIVGIMNCDITKFADCLLPYKQNWLTEGTEGLVEKKTAASPKQKLPPN